MQASAQLKELLHSINRKSYPAYKSLRGAYQFDRYILSIDHVQGDPFASPSHISVKLSHRDTGFPAESRLMTTLFMLSVNMYLGIPIM